MEKFKRFGVILLMSIFVGCSSSNSSNPVIDTPVDKHSQITYFVNGVKHDFGSDSFCAFKSENTFIINPSTTSSSIEFSFDDTGHFGYLKIDLNTGTATITSKFYTSNGYSAHYFEFDVISIDEVNKRIKGNFSGYLYADPLNLYSEQKYVNGNFDMYYYDVVPYYSKLKNSCTINGAAWRKTNTYLTRGIGALNTDISQHDTSDDEYKIVINYNQNTCNVGTFTFTPSTATNRVQLEKFDTATKQYVNYDCSGTLDILQKEYPFASQGNNTFLLKGTYSLTATNPNNSSDVIQVTDGDFKLLYTYF